MYSGKNEIILGQNLRKSIEDNLYNKILGKILSFAREFISGGYNLTNMNNGWYVREIKGNTRIEKMFKFRINEKDRVIFTFGKYLGLRPESYNSLVFLEFCNHDSQIRRGRNIVKIKSEAINSIGNIIEQNKNESDFDFLVNNMCYQYDYDYENTVNRILSINEMNEIIDSKDEKAKYYLNSEQFEIIKNNITPLFLFGSAGSGKTTIAIHKACELSKRGFHVGYFTYSDFLRKDAESIYNAIYDGEKNNNVEFHQINDYILRKSRKTQYIKYEEFTLWAEKIIESSRKITPMDVWKEIRGIIKGIVPIDWIDIKIHINMFDPEFVEYITNKTKEYAYVNGDYLYIAKGKLAEINTVINSNERNMRAFAKDLMLIYEKADEEICRKRYIDFDTYNRLTRKESRFNEDEKRYIYRIFEKYQDKLTKENKIDENDAVRLALINENGKGTSLFDFIISDEIQDLSEMEIYFLFRIAKQKENILFSGDYNQTINPTFFKTERIEAIFKSWNGLLKFKSRTITKNYRSGRSIVDFSNRLKDLKKLKLKNEEKHDYKEIPIRDSKEKLFIINKSTVSRKVLSSINDERAYLDILVIGDEEKQRFKEQNNESTVYTIKEYKGLENEYILGYNILTSLSEKWKDIFSSGSVLNDSEYRYYFNLVYVFVTRARDNICFIEEDANSEFLEFFKDNLKTISEFNLEKLKLSRVSSDDEHYKRGMHLERNGQYEMAIDAYKKARKSSFEVKHGIARCEAFIENSMGNHKKAGDSLAEIGEYRYAFECYIQAEEYTDALRSLINNEDTFEEIRDSFRDIDEDIIKIAEESSDDILIVRFNEIFKEYMEKSIFNMNKNKDKIYEQVQKITYKADEI